MRVSTIASLSADISDRTFKQWDDEQGGTWMKFTPPLPIGGDGNLLFRVEFAANGEWNGEIGFAIPNAEPNKAGARYAHARITVSQNKKVK